MDRYYNESESEWIDIITAIRAIHLTGVQHSIPSTLGNRVVSATPASCNGVPVAVRRAPYHLDLAAGDVVLRALVASELPALGHQGNLVPPESSSGKMDSPNGHYRESRIGG